MEPLFGSMQIERLDRRTWSTSPLLTAAIFEWIEAWYNPDAAPLRPGLPLTSPVEFGALHLAAPSAA